MVNNGLYGVDALGGMRPYNPELKGYLEDLRNKNTVSAYYDLMMTSFDPSDPMQRQMLDENIPGFTESKISVFESVHEQRAFIHRCSIVPKISPPERQRIVRILGGAERFLQHPMDDIVNVVAGNAEGDASSIIGAIRRFAIMISKPLAPGGNKDKNGVISGGMPGLFSYLTVPKEDRKAYDPYNRSARSDTLELRKAVATLLLKHFPRFLLGSYSPFDNDPAAKKKIADGAKLLVAYCEKVVDTIEPIGNVAKDFLPLAAAQPRADRVYRRQVQDAFSRP